MPPPNFTETLCVLHKSVQAHAQAHAHARASRGSVILQLDVIQPELLTTPTNKHGQCNICCNAFCLPHSAVWAYIYKQEDDQNNEDENKER